MFTHVVWDWNGTLSDDLWIAVESINACRSVSGLPPISRGDYRNNYQRPVRLFHEWVQGKELTDAEWEVEQATFEAAYSSRAHKAELVVDARTCLEQLKVTGVGQSVLSMLPHSQLNKAISLQAVQQYFALVEGPKGNDSSTKAGLLQKHVTNPCVRSRQDVVMIGDCVDDATAAATAGIHCVLVASAAYQPRALLQGAAPTFDTLSDAVQALPFG